MKFLRKETHESELSLSVFELVYTNAFIRCPTGALFTIQRK
ncbi:MAG TPA: hypothetical protein PLU53_01590 [Bacteroidia bacterium]|nr:hypothetical protein [Bacteroidia bacterium]